jgi:hypothetical protein
MWKKLALAFGSVLCAPALAAPVDVAQSLYGNTLVVTAPDGKVSYTQVRADRTFVGRIPSQNYLFKGSWQIDANNNLCLSYTPPLPRRTNPVCFSYVAHNAGDAWTISGVGTVSIALGTP